MRFLNRQLLRGIIAAGLAVAGASAGVASPGKFTPQWKDLCFINDSESAPQSSWNFETTSSPCQLGLGSISMDDLCVETAKQVFTAEKQVEASAPFVDATPSLQFVAQTDYSRHLCSIWVHGLRTSSSWVSHWIQQREDLVRQVEANAAKLIRTAGIFKSNGTVDEGDAKPDFQGNIFVFSLENKQAEPEAVSDMTDASLADTKLVSSTAETCEDTCAFSPVATNNRPPVLEGDLQWNIALALVNHELDPHGIGHCAIPASSASSEDAAFSVAESPSDRMVSQLESTDAESSQVPNAQVAPSTAGLQGRSLFESWIDPNWDLHTWATTTHDVSSFDRPYQPGAWTQALFAQREWIDTGFSSQQSNASVDTQERALATDISYRDLLEEQYDATQSPIESLTEDLNSETQSASESDATYSLADMPDEYTAPLDEIVGSALVSVTSGPASYLAFDESEIQLDSSLDEAGRIATKAIAQKLKQLGELLIQSADRLVQVSDSVDVASRPGNQR